MNRVIALSVLVASVAIGSAQSLDHDLKKLVNHFSENFIQVDAEQDYMVMPDHEEIEFVVNPTITGDTTGMHLFGEYIFFRDTLSTEGEVVTFTRQLPVSNKEWKEFQQWVIDSIAHLSMHEEGYEDYMIDIKHENPWGSGFVNWEKPIDWEGEGARYTLEWLTYPMHARFYSAKQFDPRVQIYEYYWGMHGESPIKERVSLLADSTLWAKDGSFGHGHRMADYYNWHPNYQADPVTGITGAQAKAYCYWKQQFLQRRLDEKGMNLEVRISLPTVTELITAGGQVPKLQTFTAYDVNAWRITNEDYKEFLDYVRDSIVRRLLAYELNEDYLIWEDDQGNEIVRPWAEGDVNWHKKIDLHDANVVALLEEMFGAEGVGKDVLESFPIPWYMFEYYWIDQVDAGKSGTINVIDSDWGPVVECEDWPCKDNDLGWTNIRGHGTGVMTHYDRSEFIIKERVNVYPGTDCHMMNSLDERSSGLWECDTCCLGYLLDEVQPYDFESDPNAQITEISYKQAIAYYHWRLRRSGHPTNNPVLLTIFPTEEQWEQVKNGQNVVLPEVTLEYPTPVFRYTMHFYEKE